MCRAPGCDQPATQIHHVRHWAHGGGTCLANLISLCDGHHWLVHEGGFAIASRGPGEWVLTGPTGVRVGPSPEPHEASEPLPADPHVAPDAITGHWDGSRLQPDDLVSLVVSAEPPAQDRSEDVSAETFSGFDGADGTAIDYSTLRINTFTT
jgi:hypothetical protein